MAAPTFLPECAWESMTPESSVPENAFLRNVQLNGEDVYVGRVVNGTRCYLGTVIPSAHVCIYLSENLEKKTSENYEILTLDRRYGAALWFVDSTGTAKDRYELFNAVIDLNNEQDKLFLARYIDNNRNTYYGWMERDLKRVYIPIEEYRGPQTVNKSIGVLVHNSMRVIRK